MLEVIWTNQAVTSLNEIYSFYWDKSEKGARNVINDLVKAPETIKFPKQYQRDEFNSSYRRVIVRTFKLLYRVEDSRIVIMDVVGTSENPIY
ncbi:type II toxin-antitoxin system RelE/ParE family toxin [Salibacter sp.]|uniref:type II toxin-antitoxin system RelE/ParE family toxin n=1 Tax=Salibacter sp. TaxID=2010995 RepID=UPI00286FD0DF|nr:type II toxin-antitoxin system RelE/ParE family toxin [Salibacter sp.]MDR9488140.1 type II toxin-antitoxin system RelE/ParE family toxin [Salibacter sp.]